MAESASRRHASRVIRLVSVLAFASSVGAGALAAHAPACKALPHDRVILSADAVDPDVFVWDDRARLVAYALGDWGDTRSVMNHTILAHPGTQAIVLSCEPGVIRPKYGEVSEDAVRVKMTSGPFRGRAGWVASGDVHASR